MYLAHQLQLVSLSLSYSIGFSVLYQGPAINSSFRLPSVLPWGQLVRQSLPFGSIIIINIQFSCPFGWSCRIYRLHLCRGVRPPPNECPGYDTKQSDSEVPVILKIWGMQSTHLLPSLPDLLGPGVEAPDRILSMGQIELKYVLMLNWITWNRTVWVFKLPSYVKLNCFK